MLINGPYIIDTSSPKLATFQTVDLALPQQMGLKCQKILLHDPSTWNGQHAHIHSCSALSLLTLKQPCCVHGRVVRSCHADLHQGTSPAYQPWHRGWSLQYVLVAGYGPSRVPSGFLQTLWGCKGNMYYASTPYHRCPRHKLTLDHTDQYQYVFEYQPGFPCL